MSALGVAKEKEILTSRVLLGNFVVKPQTSRRADCGHLRTHHIEPYCIPYLHRRRNSQYQCGRI